MVWQSWNEYILPIQFYYKTFTIREMDSEKLSSFRSLGGNTVHRTPS